MEISNVNNSIYTINIASKSSNNTVNKSGIKELAAFFTQKFNTNLPHNTALEDASIGDDELLEMQKWVNSSDFANPENILNTAKFLVKYGI